MSDSGALSHKQVKAISTLLSCQTLGEAAALAGITPRTLTRWLGDPAFQAALQAAGRESVGGAVRRLRAGRDQALDTLHSLMQSAKSENVRRLAARDWLDVLRETIMLDELEERVSDLERKIGDGES